MLEPAAAMIATLLARVGAVVVVAAVGVAAHELLGRRGRLMARARAAVRRAVESSRGEGPAPSRRWLAGAVDVDPGVLVVVFHYPDDATLGEAERSGATARLRERVLMELRRARYPAEPADVSFHSDETIARAGGGRAYFE